MKTLISQTTKSPNEDIDLLIKDVNKNIISIYKFVNNKIIEKQKELKIKLDFLDKKISNIPVAGPVLSKQLKPYLTLALGLVYDDPVTLALKINNIPILQIYDLLDNAGLIPDINPTVSLITNIYDWLQVFADIIPIYKSATTQDEIDYYHIIELGNDLYNAIRENPATSNQIDTSTLISSVVTLFSKIGAPTTRYYANPNSGLNILGYEFITNKNDKTVNIDDYKKRIESDIISLIKNNKTTSALIFSELESKYPWMKTKINPSANDEFLKEKTVDLIIEKQKIYSKVKSIFNTFKKPKIDFKWSIIKSQLNWNTLPETDKRFVADLVQQFLIN